jgi:hypothetical protein
MIRSVVLFTHVVGVLGLFVGLGVEWLSLNAVLRSTTRDEALVWVRVSGVLPRMMGMALAVIVASGFYLGTRIGVLGDGWMRASYAALLVMGIVGGPVARPRMRALIRRAESPGDQSVAHVVAAASDSILQASLRARVAFGLAVVYLMIAKPEAIDAALVMGLALILTIVWVVSRRQAQSILATEYR